MGKLDGQIGLVTGASRGIGRGIALAFAREGADVAGTYHPNEPHPSNVVAEIEATGGRALLLPCEVADEASVQAAVRQTLDAFGRIDVLVTNAGYAEETPVAAMTAAQFDRMLAVHLRGTFLCVRAVLPGMIERGSGAIITMASQLAYIGAEGLAHYSAAKAGIVAFTKSLAREVSRQGIRVNGIAPGPIRTGILPGNPARDAELQARLPIGRFGEVEEVAPTAVFLASADASYYVGQILGPNGGEVML
jgi:3-oxoacyl-[acyl-carrier protein] reductase